MKQATKVLLAIVLASLLIYLSIYETPGTHPTETGQLPFSMPHLNTSRPLTSERKQFDELQTIYIPPPIPSGSHEDWMNQAGIVRSDWPAVDYIVTRESGWNPNADGPLTELGNAHGLPQALPYSKTGCGWVDAICQLKWADSYATARYGGWWSAQNYWSSHGNW